MTFTVATNPGAPAGALNRIASGGELSRFLLALKVCLTRDARGLTMIFDEIDRGVGGATADAVGRRLQTLAAEGGQVLVVTHSPQVAALGAHHWRVEKAVEGGQTLSRVVPLDAAARIDEIARMLAGDTVTDAAREAARALLDGSARAEPAAGQGDRAVDDPVRVLRTEGQFGDRQPQQVAQREAPSADGLAAYRKRAVPTPQNFQAVPESLVTR